MLKLLLTFVVLVIVVSEGHDRKFWRKRKNVEFRRKDYKLGRHEKRYIIEGITTGNGNDEEMKSRMERMQAYKQKIKNYNKKLLKKNKKKTGRKKNIPQKTQPIITSHFDPITSDDSSFKNRRYLETSQLQYQQKHVKNRSKTRDRKCGDVTCKNRGRCDNFEARNLTRKLCLCRLGTSGRRCELENVMVKTPSFSGKSFIAFPPPKNSFRSFKISITIKPEKGEGLLLHTSDLYSSDALSVYLNSNQVVVRMDCGTGAGMVRSEDRVELGRWNEVVVERFEKEMAVSIDAGVKSFGYTKGAFSLTTFTDHLFVGGHNNMKKLAHLINIRHGVIGCIKEVKINENSLDLRKKPFAGDALFGWDIDECNRGACAEKRCRNGGVCVEEGLCVCDLGFHGDLCQFRSEREIQIPSFSNHSYLRYVGLRRTALNNLSINMTFLSRSTEGLLLYNGFSSEGVGDYVSLAIINGFVEFSYELGTGPAKIRSAEKIVLNKWHQVRAWREGKNGGLQLDGGQVMRGQSEGEFTQLTLSLDLFVGGHRNINEVTKITSLSLDGCVQELVINDQTLKLTREAIGGLNIGSCSNHVCSSQQTCLNGGRCLPSLEHYSCECLPGFSGVHCAQRVTRQRYRRKQTQTKRLKSI